MWFLMDGDFVPSRITEIFSFQGWKHMWKHLTEKFNDLENVEKLNISAFKETQDDFGVPSDIERLICDM